jgi:hypothetical protein
MRRDEPWCFEALLPGEELKVRPERLMQLYERIESELYHVADGLFAVQASPLEVAMSAMADVESAGHKGRLGGDRGRCRGTRRRVRRLVSTGVRSNPGRWESPATILMEQVL